MIDPGRRAYGYPHGKNGKPREDLMARDETDRYRQAAQDALEQLDWCIGYLHGIHKTKISSQLAKNRSHIKRNLMQDESSPVPSEVTAET
jgi:hypothetical protein